MVMLMEEKVKGALKFAGGEKMVEWEKYFGAGPYGAALSIGAGALILAFPGLMTLTVGAYLIIRGVLEVFKYTRLKSLRAVEMANHIAKAFN
jgi:uncharacterized membrane protein HdeD (DUF308 family)